MDTTPIKELILEIQKNPPPGRLAVITVELSSWFATLSQQLEDILVFKADRWQELRKDCKSDKSTDRLWDSLVEGKNEIKLRSQLKYLEKIISSIKFLLRVKEVESYGKY